MDQKSGIPHSSRVAAGAAAVDGAGIRIQGLRKVYDTPRGDLEVLRGIDTRIGPGEVVSLIGPSGCGKSTLLLALAGLVEPTGGEVEMFGAPPQAGRRDIGMMFQSTVLLPWRTVLGNIVLPLKVFGLDREAQLARAADVLELVELSAFRDAYPWQLSGGMQQRVALARVLAYHPQALLMDEPFSALDELTRQRLNFEFSRINASSEAAVVLVTHSIEEAVTLSDRILVMRANPGEIVTDVRVNLPQPRTPDVVDESAFTEAMNAVRHTIVRDWARTSATTPGSEPT